MLHEHKEGWQILYEEVSDVQGNPGPYVYESTALCTNEAMGERWKVMTTPLM